MKNGSTDAITEFLLWNACNAKERAHPVAVIKYWDGAAFKKLDDVKSLRAGISNNNKQHGKFLLVPPTNSMSANIDNRQSKYSPGTGNEFDGILIRNRRAKAFIGYKIGEGATQSIDHSVNDYSILYHTKIVSTQIKNDITSASSFTNLPGISDNWTFYDTETYDDSTYAPEGYYLSDILEFEIDQKVKSITLDSDVTSIDVYIRASNVYEDLSNNVETFQFIGSTGIGTKILPFDELDDKYFQFALVFRTGAWDTGYVQNISIQHTDTVETFPVGEYLLDDPAFNAAFGRYSAAFSARDKFKKAYETQVNCPAYTSTDVAAIMRDIADKVNIPHNDGSELIPNTGFTVTIAASDTFTDEKAIDIFNECMFYLNFKNDNYKLELSEEGYLQLVLLDESIRNVDWQIDYRYNMLSISKKFESDKLLNRITILTKEHTVDEQIQLATDTKTSAGTYDLSWSGKAIYKEVTATGTGIFVLNYVQGEKINYTLSGGTINMTITVRGNKLQASPPFQGEAIYFDNHKEKDGFTKKIINRLPQSDAEVQEMAEGIRDIWGDPEFTTNIKLPCNPLLQLGDFVLLWEKNTNTNTIYRIDKIGISYNAKGARCYQTLNLSDTGIEYTNINWDRHNVINGGKNPGIDDRQWDKGSIWDQDLGVGVTEDTTNYDSYKKIPVG